MSKILFSWLLLMPWSGFAKVDYQVIYGEDNRLEVLEADLWRQELAHSTLAIIPEGKVISHTDGQYRIASEQLGDTYGICSEERFVTQPTAANCSGFLVGPDLVVTAGHCISAGNCNSNFFVFGYQMDASGEAVLRLPESNVYSCKEVIVTNVEGQGADYAVVRLDRAVVGREPLRLSPRSATKGDEVFVIGHPSGLPTKITTEGFVRATRIEHFVANLDTYGGNSGSAVFDERTGSVVGILVRGEADYQYDSARRCSVSKVCENTKCRGEDVTHIDQVFPYLPNFSPLR